MLRVFTGLWEGGGGVGGGLGFVAGWVCGGVADSWVGSAAYVRGDTFLLREFKV